MKTDSYCGAGAPRFNVAVDKTTQFFGCTYGTHTPLSDGWTHVEFQGPFSAGKINGVDLVQDEQGQTQLRNISVNGVTFDKFSSN